MVSLPIVQQNTQPIPKTAFGGEQKGYSACEVCSGKSVEATTVGPSCKSFVDVIRVVKRAFPISVIVHTVKRVSFRKL